MTKMKGLRFLLCLLMVVLLVPVYAAQANENEGEVTITKELVSSTPDEDGCYTIRLTVSGVPITENVQPNADVVLVVDCSGSMAEPQGSPRITTAKEAGKAFADGILTEGSGNKMAVIGFSSREFSIFWGWQGDPISVKTDLVEDVETIHGAIDGMKANGGTDYTSALQAAYDILSDREDTSRPGYVLFLSDGAPGLTGESQQDPTWNGSNQIAALKADGITIYTVGIALEEEAAGYLKQMATSDEHYIHLSQEDLDAQLETVLTNWASRINRIPAGVEAVVVDAISEWFEYVSSEDGLVYSVENGEETLTWEIGDIPEEAISITFRIRPKDGVYGEYPTNDECILRYVPSDSPGDWEEISHASPEVEIPEPDPVRVVVYKLNENEQPLPGALFYLYEEIDGVLTEEPRYEKVSGEDGVADFYVESSGIYVLTEEEAPEGYIRSEESWRFLVDVENGSVAIFDADAQDFVPYEKYLVIENVPIPDPVYYTVTFHTDGGSEVAMQTVEAGSLAVEPVAPFKGGYLFGGWYTDSSLAEEFDFSKPILENTDVYAKWVKMPQTDDPSNMTPWIVVMGVSVLSLVGVVFYSRRKRAGR